MLSISGQATSVERCGADDLAAQTGLYTQLETVLTSRWQHNPQDIKLLRQLADCKRKLGKLDEAQQHYQTLAQLSGQPADTYALKALSACLNPADQQPQGYLQAPLFIWHNVLSADKLQQLLDYYQTHQTQFSAALVGQQQSAGYRPEQRNNIDLKGKHPVKADFRQRILAKLPTITQALGMEPFTPSFIEVKLRATRQGEYFRTHQDAGRSGRKLSYVYFFYPQPRRYTGGDLVVFDTDAQSKTYNDAFTRITPHNNTLVFFPSHFYHAALPVTTTDDIFIHTRLSINGHIKG